MRRRKTQEERDKDQPQIGQSNKRTSYPPDSSRPNMTPQQTLLNHRNEKKVQKNVYEEKKRY
jgi:hypothetical protein